MAPPHGVAVVQAANALAEALDARSQDVDAGGTLRAVAAVERLRPEELARPAALRPLLTLLGCGDPGVERLALALLTALVDSSAEAATLVRGFGGIEALSRAAGAALEAAQRARDEAAAVEDAASAASALRALHRLLSPPTIASRAVPRSSQHSAGAGGQDGNGRMSNGVRSPSGSSSAFAKNLTALKSAGGVPVLILALQCGADADVVMHALAIISDAVSLEAGRSEDGSLSDSSSAFVVALVRERGLHAMALIVAEVEQTQQRPAAAEVVRCFTALVEADAGTLASLQAAHGVTAVITLLLERGDGPAIGSGGGSGSRRFLDNKLYALAQQACAPNLALLLALSTFARHTAPAESAAAADLPDGVSEQSDDDSSSPSIHAMRRSESTSANRNQAGKTALHWAAQFGEAQLLHELIRTAEDVNPLDEAGNTPLHLAALNGHLDCVQQLLTCGGDSMAYNRDDNLPCDLGSSGSQVWTMLERDMQWRTCLQARHPCEIVWAEPESATSQMAGGTAGSAGFDGDSFSLPEGLPELVALRCHFEPLTGEVCIAGADGPDGGSLAAGLKDGKGRKKSKLRRRLMSVISPARAAAMKAAEKAAGAAVAAEPVERYPVPYTLAVSTVDKLTLELDFCAEDIAGGYLGNESLPAVVASMTVQMCSAGDLGPALGTMLTRLFPHIFRAQAPLRRSQLLAQELTLVQREAQQRSSSDPGFAAQAAARRSELVRRLRRRLDRLQAQLEASRVEVLTSYRARVDDLRMANLSLLTAEPPSPVASPPQAAADGGGRVAATGHAASAAKDAQLAASMRDMREGLRNAAAAPEEAPAVDQLHSPAQRSPNGTAALARTKSGKAIVGVRVGVSPDGKRQQSVKLSSPRSDGAQQQHHAPTIAVVPVSKPMTEALSVAASTPGALTGR